MTDPIRIPAFNSVTVGHLLARITALEACEEAKRSIYGEPSREMQDEMRRLLGRHQANPVDAGPAVDRRKIAAELIKLKNEIRRSPAVKDTIWHTDTETVCDALWRLAMDLDPATEIDNEIQNKDTPPADDAAVEAIRSAVRVEHPLTRGSLNISSSITEADARKILDAIVAELNQAAHAAAALPRKERTMKKAKPMPKPTKPGKKKKGC